MTTGEILILSEKSLVKADSRVPGVGEFVAHGQHDASL